MRVMQDEEVRKWDATVRAFYRNPDLTKNVAAVLMDTHIGGAGDNEKTALVKAAAILRLLGAKRLLKRHAGR